MGHGQKSKILIVEHDTFLAGIYAEKFEQEGFEVTHASDGEIGLVRATKEMPDVILMDILLPKLNGFEVLEKIKGNKKTENIPVILLTNLGQKEDVDRGLALGAADYLIKAHFMPAATAEKVRKALGAG